MAANAEMLSLTLGDALELLGIEAPEAESVSHRRISSICCSPVLTRADSLCFVRGSGEAARKRTEEYFAKGALAVVVPEDICEECGALGVCIPCANPTLDCVELVRRMRLGNKTKSVAITGSVGKTSAKEMFQLVAKQRYKIGFSRGNENGLGQVVRHVQAYSDDLEIYIQEVGLSKPNSVKYASIALTPDYFLITNIGLNHVGYFGGRQENILAEKLNVDKYASPGAVGFVNLDDPLLKAASYEHRVATFAIDDKEADYRATDIVEKNAKVFFTLVDRVHGTSIPVTLNLPGRHNVYNALAAYAFGIEIGVSESEIVHALSLFKAKGVRQNLVRLNGQYVYLDCYNASENAIKSTISTMESIDIPDGAKRVVVLGDIDDKLGERTEEVHRRVGKWIRERSSIDCVLFFGEHMKWAAEELEGSSKWVYATSDRSRLEGAVRRIVQHGDLLGFKGGQQMRLSLTVDNLFGTSFYMLDGDVLRKDMLFERESRGFKYRAYADYGAVLKSWHDAGPTRMDRIKAKLTGKKRVVSAKVPKRVERRTVRLIGARSFMGSAIVSVQLSEGVKGVARSAFRKCRKLKTVKMPSSLKFIGPRAFAGCWSLRSIELPEGVETISSKAFSYCRNLKRINLPASVKTIEHDAFYRSPNVEIVCRKGSDAEEICSRIDGVTVSSW